MAEWTDSENKRFERALAAYGTDEPGRWDRVAAAVGGGRTAEDVRRHFDRLVHDVRDIEAGGGANRGSTAGNSNGENNDASRSSRPQT